MSRLELAPFALTFRTPLRTARATYQRREGFLVRAVGAGGRVGQGEAMPLPEFGTESREACGEALRSVAARLEGCTLEGDLSSLSALLGPMAAPAARHAVELALLDLLAQERGVSLSRLLCASPRPHVRVNALLGARAPELLADEAREAVLQGFETLKVKVGGAPLQEDVARLAALREAVGAGPALRVDANGAWSAAEARAALARLGAFGLELCEQPVPAKDAGSWRQLGAPCALGADESLAVPGLVEQLLAERSVDVLVLKPMVLGGLLPALALAQRAAAVGVSAYVTSSLDGVVARAGAAQLAAALPSDAFASGLAVGHLFVEEAAHAYSPVQGRIVIPQGPGLGWEAENSR